MSTGLHLTVDEFDRMVDRGAFDHLNRKIELVRGELRETNTGSLTRNASCVHVLRKPIGMEYTDRQIVNIGETIAPLAAPEAKLDVRDLFAI